MPFKLFEFQEQSIMDAFLKTLTQHEKIGSTGKVFIQLEILKLNSTFEHGNRSFFRAVSTFVFGQSY